MTERGPIDEFPIALRRGGMDTMGHVNNTVPFRDMKQTRISGFDFPKRGSAPPAGACARSDPASPQRVVIIAISGWPQ